MRHPALIIFVRNPVPGRVKRRLADSLGEAAALDVYRALLRHTHRVTHRLPATRAVFYADGVQHGDLWSGGHYLKFRQHGADLGARMAHAFQRLFVRGHAPVVIVGSDCPQLTPAILWEAFVALRSHDLVLGPALDGGYYLLGMNHPHPALFRDKRWSTPTVLRDTLRDIRRLDRTVHLLLPLLDIDTGEDLEHFRLLHGRHALQHHHPHL